jgi:hypothetical protein
MSKRTLILLAAALLLIAAAVYSAFYDKKIIVEPEVEPEAEPEPDPETEIKTSEDPNIINADSCVVRAMPEPIIRKSSRKTKEDEQIL